MTTPPRSTPRLLVAAAAALGLVSSVGAAAAVSSREDPIPRRLLIAAGSRLPTHEPVLELWSDTGRRERFVTRLGSSPGEPAWSPDGTRFAWSDWRGIHLERGDGTHHRLVVKSPCPYASCGNYSFAWSPDSRSLAVGGVGRLHDRLMIVSTATGKARDITPARRSRGCRSFGDATCVEYRVIGWSRGARPIAYETYTHTGWNPDDAVWVVSRDGKHPRMLKRMNDPIHDGPSAALSPDARTLALITDHRDRGDPAFALVDTATRRVRVVRIDGEVQQPAWSPDGRLAVVTGTGIVVLDAAGRRLVSLHVRGGSPAWTRSGDLILVRARSVLVSVAGRAAPRLLFRMRSGPGLPAALPNW